MDMKSVYNFKPNKHIFVKSFVLKNVGLFSYRDVI